MARQKPPHCALCGTSDSLEVNETWAGTLHSACTHAACRPCLKRHIHNSLGDCVHTRQLRLPCFQQGCCKMLPQALVLGLSNEANILAEALDADSDVALQQCSLCGRASLLLENGCGHAACADCWMECAVLQLDTRREEGCRELRCFACSTAMDRNIARRLLPFSIEAKEVSRFYTEADEEARTLKDTGFVVAAVEKSVGPVCNICGRHALALLSSGCMDERHGACMACWAAWAGEQVDRGVLRKELTVPCMHFGCGGACTRKHWPLLCTRNAAFGGLQKKLDWRRRLQSSPFYPAELQVDCPREGCVGLGYLGHDTTMCFVCEHVWVPAEGAGLKPQTDVEMIMGVAVKKCPKCNEYIEKNGGCDHMTCRCGHEFCWSTLLPYRPSC